VRVIPNGIDLDVLTAGQKVSLRRILNLTDEPLVAFVGKPSPDKNVARFIDVTRHLIAANPTLHVAIIGHGFEEGARGAIAPGLCPRRVHFMGPRPDVPKLLAEVDVLVVTSTSEGCPNVVLEALASGTCVVSSDVGDVARMLADTAGEVVDRDETALFVEAIQRLIDRGRPRSTAASVMRTRSEYGLERMVHRTVSLWAEMLNHRHPAPGPLLDDPDVPGSLQTAP
jgi:glycosyltransferase involved in cell wall biosynthesis